jgi:hypothetical protein
MEQRYPKSDDNKILSPDWPDWLRYQIVRREAELLLKSSAQPTK